MNDFLEVAMDLLPWQITQKKKALKEYWIITLVLAFFYAIVCVPISIVTTTDAVVIDSHFPLIWETAMQFLNYLFYWISFSYLMYFVFAFGFGEIKDFLIAYGLIVCLRYGLNQFVTSFLYGFPSVEDFVANSLGEMVTFIVLDMAQMAVAILFAYLCARKKITLRSHMPFKKMFDLKNPLLSTAFKIAWIPAVIMLGQRFVYDLGFVKEMPKELLPFIAILFFYLADILCVFLGYFVILSFLNKFFLRNEEARLSYDQYGETE